MADSLGKNGVLNSDIYKQDLKRFWVLAFFFNSIQLLALVFISSSNETLVPLLLCFTQLWTHK